MAQVATPRVPPAAADPAPPDARRFLPPPNVHPNSAVFGAANLPKPLTWQRREHMVQRRSILGRIGQLLTRNAQLVAGAGAGSDVDAKTWALARKLEVLIFLNSASLLEYNNVDSLARRVQAMTASIVNKKIRREIVTQSQPPPPSPLHPPHGQLPVPVACRPIAMQAVPQTITPHAAAAPVQSFTEMMRSAIGGHADVLPVAPAHASQPMLSNAQVPRLDHIVSGTLPVSLMPGGGKRSASEMMMSMPTADGLLSPTAAAATKHARFHHQIPSPPVGTSLLTSAEIAQTPHRVGSLLFQGFDEINKIVWSYVDGAQIMRSRAVSRAARVVAPLFVTSLQLSCNATLMALNTFSLKSGGCILRECVNLKEFEVVSLSSGMTFGKLSMRAMNCPQRFVVTHDDHEQIVLALSQQLRYNAFPRLTRLGLTCLFTNEEADGEADVLLNNLMTGCCPQLEELCLPGNSFGDYGAIKIAQMLRARVCPKLTRLDLRRNFISEEGIRSVCHALADGCAPQLVELCLGGNTITDSCFHHVLFAMESRKLPHLRFLGIEMNYLTATSMEMLGRTIGKMVCPLLSQISYSDNSVDNAEAKRLIATAVYQERMFRLRQQQLRRQQRLSDHRQQQRLLSVPNQQYQSQQTGATQSALPHPTMFPYTHDFPPASSVRGPGMSAGVVSGGGGGGAPYLLDGNYSSGEDDDDDDDQTSSDGDA